MTILAYEEHSNVASAKAMLQLFKAFAVAQGWTIIHDQVSKAWASIGGGLFGWVAGTEDFLCLKSTGYGSQDLQFRLSTTNLASLVARVRLVAYTGATTLDSSNSGHPISQTTAGQNRWSSTSLQENTFPDSSGGPIESVWFFGNNKILFIIAKTASDYCVNMAFGSPELYDTAEDEGNFCGWVQGSLSSANYYYNKTLRGPLDISTTQSIFYDGVLKTTNGAPNFVFPTSGIATVSNFTGGYGRLVRQNSYAEIKPIFKQTIYVQHTSDSKYRALGTMWVYRTYFLPTWEIGKRVLYGVEEYILFPGGQIGWPAGYAYRIS